MFYSSCYEREALVGFKQLLGLGLCLQLGKGNRIGIAYNLSAGFLMVDTLNRDVKQTTILGVAVWNQVLSAVEVKDFVEFFQDEGG